MSSVSNINNSNEYYYLNETGENLGEIEETVSIFTDTTEEISSTELAVLTSETALSTEDFVSSLDDSTKDVLIEVLENIVTAEEDALNETKNNNGVIASAWDWFKNKTGIGQGSDKVQSEIDDLKSQIEELKSDSSKLAEVYKNVTGNELTSDGLTSLVNGEADFSDSKVVNSVSKYQQGQKQVVNTVSSVVSGITVVGLVTAGVAAAPFTCGMSLGASLAAIGTLTAAGTAAYMVPQVVDGVTEADGYSASEIAEDVATGVINSAVTAASLGAGKALGSTVTKAVTTNTEAIASALGVSAETATKIGTKTAGLVATETTSVLMSDGIAVGDYLVEAALNEDVDFSLETLGTTAASATAAGLAAGITAYGTSSIIRPALTSGTTASSQIAGRLLSSGISGASAGASATAAAGSTSYLISCSVNGEEVNFDDWLNATTENMAAGALTGFAAGIAFEAVQITAGTPAPDGTVKKQSGTTEDGLKYTEYLDKDGNIIARDFKASDVSNAVKAQSSSQNGNELVEYGSDSSSNLSSSSNARTVRIYVNTQSAEGAVNGTSYTAYADTYTGYRIDWADNSTFIGQTTDVTLVENSTAAVNASEYLFDNTPSNTLLVSNEVNAAQTSAANSNTEIVPANGISNSYLQPQTAEITNIETANSTAMSASATTESSVAASTQLSSVAAVNAASNYKASISANTQNPTAVQNTNTNPYENLFFETLDETQIQGQLAFTEVHTPQEELIINESAQNLPADTPIDGQLSIDDYFESFEQEYILQNSSTDPQSVQLTENVNKTTQNVSDNSQLTATEIQETTQLTKEDITNLEYYKNGEHYEKINSALREGNASKKIQGIVDSIDKAFETDGTVLEEDTVLYRGVSRHFNWDEDVMDLESPYDNLKIGDTFTEDAYTSTSKDIEVATSKEYINEKVTENSKSGYLLEIHAPAGTNTLDIEQTINKNGGRSLALNESEVLLEHGTTYAVRKIIEGYNGAYQYYDTIVLDIVNPVEETANSVMAQTTDSTTQISTNAETPSIQRFSTIEEAKEYFSAMGTDDSRTVLKNLNKPDEDESTLLKRVNTAIDILEGGETKTKLKNYANELSKEHSSDSFTTDTMLEIYDALGIKPNGEITQDDDGIYHSKSDELGTITGRAKGADSTYSKLKNKMLKLGIDLPSSAKEAKPLIGDAQGIRLVLNSSGQISADVFENSEKIINELPEQSDRELFVKYLSGDTEGISDEQLEQFAELRIKGLQELSDIQTQKFVDGLSEAIVSGNIRMTEVHNYYGEDGLPYLSETQLTQIETAYNGWYEKTFATADTEESSYKKMYEIDKQTGEEKEYLYDTKSGAKFYEELIMETETKDNGYTASQFNLVNQYNQMEELQFRVEEVDRIAEIEHMVYDINNNKETVSGSEYDDIRQALTKIKNSKKTDAEGKTAQQEYDDYFNAVYTHARTTELGAYAEEPDIYEDYPLLKELFSEDELYLISIEGLKEFHNQLTSPQKNIGE